MRYCFSNVAPVQEQEMQLCQCRVYVNLVDQCMMRYLPYCFADIDGLKERVKSTKCCMQLIFIKDTFCPLFVCPFEYGYGCDHV